MTDQSMREKGDKNIMAGENTVEERVKEAVAKVFHKPVSQLSRETCFVRDLYAKSLNIIELTAVLENEFGVEIPGVETRRRNTIGEVVDLIESLLKKQ
jgi:acyl carrier protein